MTEPARILKSLNLTLDVLEALGRDDRAKGVSELAAQVGASKGAVHVILVNLQARGYVQRDDASTAFTLGRAAWHLGQRAGRAFDLSTVAEPVLARLASDTGESAHVAVFERPGSIRFVHRAMGPNPVQVVVPLGGVAPLTTTALGLVLLAAQPDEVVEELLRQPLPAPSPLSIRTPDQLRARLAAVRREGVAVVEGLHHPEIAAVAAPVRAGLGQVVAAIGVFGPVYRIDKARLRGFVAPVAAAAAELSRELGLPDEGENRPPPGRERSAAARRRR